MNLTEEKFTLLHDLAEISGSGYDPGNVFHQIRNIIEQLLECDSVMIFTNDQQNHVLSASNKYNHLTSSFNNLTIPYSDSLVIDLLVNKKHQTRLKPENPVLPESRSELFAPILSPKEVLGCLYLGRKEENAFSPVEIKLLDLALGHIAIVLERSEWEKQQYDIKNVKQKNKVLTKSFLESLQQPAIIIDTFRDQIYQVNNTFAGLLNYGKAELLKAPFTTICRDHLSIKALTPDNKQNLTTHWTTRENTLLNLKTIYTFLDNVDKGLLLLIFQPENDRDNDLKTFWLHELFASLSTVSFHDLQKDYTNAANIILNLFGADYLTLHKLHPQNGYQLLATYANHEDENAPIDDKLLKVFGAGVNMVLAEKKQPVYIDDISTSKYHEKLKPVTDAGIRSLVCMPLQINQEHLGLMNVYFNQPFKWDNKNKIKLASICQISSNFIFAPQLVNDFKESQGRQSLLDKLTRQLFSEKALKENMTVLTKELISFIHFDYLSLTLFDDQGNIDQSIDLTWPDLLKLYDPPLKHQPPKGDDPVQVFQALKNGTAPNSMQPFRLPFSMPAHTSVILISGERYLGNFSLGRLQKTPFTRPENDLLKQISTILSSALRVQMASASNDTSRLLEEFHNKISVQAFRGTEKQEFMNTICMAVKSTLNGADCKNVFIQENTRILDLFDWISKPLLARLSQAKIKKMLVELKKSKKPLLVPNVKEYHRLLCSDDAETKQSSSLKPFIISPVVINNQIHALILIVLEEDANNPAYTAHILELFTRQAEQWLLQYQQVRELVEQNKSLNEYTHMVSHELKSPLQTIKNYTSIIKEDLGDSVSHETEQYLTRLLHNLENMEQMITELLTMSNLDGKNLDMEEMTAQSVLEEAITLVQGLVDMRNAQIHIDESLPRLYGNKTGLEHIFSNLISNAIKYTKESETPVINITGRSYDGSVEFTVQDNGIGISGKNLEKIFDPFFKQHDKAKYKSSGLGLAIVKKIITLHHGDIHVESAPGSGSKFIFSLAAKAS